MEVKTLYEPRLAQLDDSEKTYLIQRGGQQVQWYPFTAQSASNSNLVFKLDPPSPSTVLDRNLIIQVPFTATFTGIPPLDNSLLQPNQYSLRGYPFSSVVDNLVLTVNGQAVTMQLSNIVHMLSRYNNTSESRSTFSSMFPNTLDSYQTYTAGATSNSPLKSYEGVIPGCYTPRGAYDLQVTANPAGDGVNPVTCTLSGVINEYVNISPFYQRAQEGTGGLSNIQNLTANFSMSGLERMFSIVPHTATPGAGFSGGSVTLGNPKIYCGFVTTPVDFTIPRSLNFSYNDYSYYSNQVTESVAPGAKATTLNSNVIQWSQLPEKVYIAVRRNRGSLTNTLNGKVSNTDTYFAIDKININFANQDGIQSATTQEALYLQSVRNGCNMSFIEWSGKSYKLDGTASNTTTLVGTVGSVLALEFGRDIPLSGLDAPGMSGSWNFQVRVDATNVSDEAIVPELAIIAVFDGIMTIENPGQAFVTLGIVTPEMVLQAPRSDTDYDDIMRMHGGSFGSNIKRFFKKNPQLISTLGNIGQAVGNVVAPRLTGAISEGVDVGRNIVQAAQQDARAATQQQGAALQGGLSAGLRAGQLKGGAAIPKSTLRSRAR